MAFKNYREESRNKQWGSEQENHPTIEQINCGSMLRIADAVEKMASDYDALRRDRDFWKERAEARARTINFLNRAIAGLRGRITVLKRRMP